mmetsp:Transcript_8943/g.12309  ORF Transcript_8943/g.12309 Transcript_8943/m.12309 type:complete len:162 (-) Transcript_8943:277-762(-)|eukprot:CAMPEP_0185263510 /NCGR_PEP_ID=MMETSP1359-20130426/15249_1 /TAXON_ID=552665 /ORGANISM="Bigelowiella longifila, Strain CCMP242" /LENGTH=161 /DNA_ID=CAMNT_0027851091 /DNA_START=178 /DNA_END=663 /DNA_ORIENTATION=-
MKSSQEREANVAHPRPIYAMLSKDECTRSAWNCSRSCDSKSSSIASVSTHNNSGNKRLREPSAQQSDHHPNKKHRNPTLKGMKTSSLEYNKSLTVHQEFMTPLMVSAPANMESGIKTPVNGSPKNSAILATKAPINDEQPCSMVDSTNKPQDTKPVRPHSE